LASYATGEVDKLEVANGRQKKIVRKIWQSSKSLAVTSKIICARPCRR